MVRRPPRATRTDTLFPFTSLCRSVSSAFADPADLQRTILSGRQLLLSPATLSHARLVAPQESVGFDVLTFKDDARALQLHPVAGRVSHAVIPTAIPPGTRRVSAVVQTDNVAGPWVEYAMLLTPPAPRARRPEDRRAGKECRSTCRYSGWPL